MKKILLGLLGLFGLIFLARNVLAYDLTLTSVGSQSTLGVDYSLVSYVGGVPTLVGTASPSASVGVKIKAILNYTTASVSGIWEFVPTTLDQGDNQVVLSSGDQSISFVLRFNSTESGEVVTPAAIVSELPDSGVWEYYIPVVGIGIAVLFLGRFGRQWMQNWDRDD